MDHKWAADRLREFLDYIDALAYMETADGEDYDRAVDRSGLPGDVADQIITLDPVMRDLMNAARPGLGDYQGYVSWNPYKSEYWLTYARHPVLQTIGIHELGEEARLRMRPDTPDLTADQLHPWVWEAAAPLWNAGSRQEAVHAAARSVNARMQQKRGHRGKSDAALCREFFSPDPPMPGRPRLRFQGYSETDPTRKSRQVGAMDFGAGCFEGIRNPAAHEHGLDLSDQVALEQLAAFSLLARWIEECEVESAPAPEAEAS